MCPRGPVARRWNRLLLGRSGEPRALGGLCIACAATTIATSGIKTVPPSRASVAQAGVGCETLWLD